ncbi:PAS domain-containing protein [Sinorhizobium alkalisoli]|uniref:PAS domain-containing protein n=1 Tax=Sinorhizobium alkalisoli TaxID=1752398 RepID=UPI00124D4B31|nr:PAS domain-containing protein [Sinorhizobium alkalisoli]QFI66058.1 hypothetical protein EKH55_1184 [Sinorhizobium alkalisoli]
MRSRTSVDLFRYWNTLRGDRNLPRRDEISPGDIRLLLPDVFILQRQVSGPIRFRLAGTRICTLFGSELRDQPFSALWEEKEMTDLDRVAGRVMAQCTPMLVSAFGRTAAGDEIELELLLAPLASADGRNDRVLGTLSPLTCPRWLHLTPITALATSGLSVLHRDHDMSRKDVNTPPAAANIGIEAGHARGRVLNLRVLDGGRRD